MPLDVGRLAKIPQLSHVLLRVTPVDVEALHFKGILGPVRWPACRFPCDEVLDLVNQLLHVTVDLGLGRLGLRYRGWLALLVAPGTRGQRSFLVSACSIVPAGALPLTRTAEWTRGPGLLTCYVKDETANGPRRLRYFFGSIRTLKYVSITATMNLSGGSPLNPSVLTRTLL